MHDFECGQEVAQEEDEEGESQYEYLPFSAFLMAGELEQCHSIVELPEVATEQEWQQEGEAPPHPGLEPFHSEIQVIPLAQGTQPVQAASLVVIL